MKREPERQTHIKKNLPQNVGEIEQTNKNLENSEAQYS